MAIAIAIVWTLLVLGFGYGLAEARHVWELERSAKWVLLTLAFCTVGGWIFYATK